MSSSRVLLRFTAGVLCSSILCLDSVSASRPCASEDVFESSPVWNGKLVFWGHGCLFLGLSHSEEYLSCDVPTYAIDGKDTFL